VAVDYITIRDNFTLAHKYSSKEFPPSDSLALTSSIWITCVGKARDEDAILVMLNDDPRFKRLK
jgi:hypothetical protein